MERSVPADTQAERAALGCVLQDGATVEQVADWLPPEYFYLEKHAYVYEAMLACYARREPPDITTVAAELRRHTFELPTGDVSRLDAVGGIAFLMDLTTATDQPYRIEHYARTVERTAVLRRLIESGGKIAALGYEESRELDETLDKAEQELFSVSQRRAAQGALGVDLADAVGEWWARVERLQSGEEEPGISTGWRDLDERLMLRRGQFHVIAARPGVGKSTTALAMLRSMARLGRKVDYYSLEMERMLIQDWLYGMEAGVNADHIQRGRLSPRELSALAAGAGRASQWPIHIVDKFQLSHLGLRGYARRRHARAKPDVLFVDHLGLIASPPSSESRHLAIGEITRGFVNLALELDVAIIALCQLNREVEKRASKVPTLSDLRESGRIEEDAATVLFLHRPGSYDPEATPGLTEIHCAKNRNRGGIGWKVTMQFDPVTLAPAEPTGYQEAPGYDYADAA
jgi:replicative DNA helicase